jgi:putative peptidoglycan lipid II flippase
MCRPTRSLIDDVATVLTWALIAHLRASACWRAPLLVWIMASGLQQDPRGFEAAVVMTRWMFPYIGFMSLVALGAGVLNTWKRFAGPGVHAGAVESVHDRWSAWLGAHPGSRDTGHRADLCAGDGGVIRRWRAATGASRWLAMRRLGLMPTHPLAAGSGCGQAWDEPRHPAHRDA